MILSIGTKGATAMAVALVCATLTFLPTTVGAVFVEVTEEALGYSHGAVPGVAAIAWPDVDADGYPDLFVGPAHLFMNDGDGTFTYVAPDVSGLDLVDVGGEARATFADVTGDGFVEVVVADYYGSHSWYFVNSGPPDFTFSGSLMHTFEPGVFGGQPTFVDGDGDRTPELYQGLLGSWDPPTVGLDRYLALVADDWTDVTTSRIPALDTEAYRRPVRGSNACDYDDDGDVDIFVPVYGITATESHDNMLWRNDGTGQFTDAARGAGVHTETHSDYGGLASGASWGDFDNDGDFDLVVANIHGWAVLWRNEGDGTFSTANADAGLPQSNGEWHGSMFFDYDNDGDLDLWLTKWYDYQYSRIYRNDGPDDLGHYTEVTAILGFDHDTHLNFTQGLACADYDRDGDLDVAFDNIWNDATYRGQYLWRNDLDASSADNHWLVVVLQDPAGDAGILNARIRLRYTDGTWSGVRQVESTSSDLSMNMHPVHFGLGEHGALDHATVRWMHGEEERFEIAAVDQWVTLVRGEGATPTGIVDDPGVAVPGLGLAPNPSRAGETVHLRLPSARPYKVTLYDPRGRAVRTWQVAPAGHLFDLEIPTRGLAAGVYFVKARGADQEVSRALTIVR